MEIAFQSSPDLAVGRYVAPGSLPARPNGFNPRPTSRSGATACFELLDLLEFAAKVAPTARGAMRSQCPSICHIATSGGPSTGLPCRETPCLFPPLGVRAGVP